VISNNGMVHPGLKSNMTYHRGFPVRGIISTESLWSWTSVLTVPRSLWLDRDTFKETKAVSLQHIVECRNMHSDMDEETLKFGAGLALENKKGSGSFYFPWLRSLPSWADFHSFLPRLMEPSLRQDFSALPFVTAMTKVQQQDSAMRDCFQAWQKEPYSVVASITWQETSRMLSVYKTRSIDAGGLPFMIPAMDLLNTENSEEASAQWDIAHMEFTLSTQLAGLSAGAELTEEYCPSCSNFELMAIWGIFLEDNLNDVGETDTSFCYNSANSTGKSNLTSDQSPVSLRKATEAMLDFKSQSLSSQWRAPRCQPEKVMSSEQGPLRCSLARLAWEQCHVEWNRQDGGSSVHLAQSDSRRAINGTHIDNDFVTLLSQSHIGAVHQRLLPLKKHSVTKGNLRQPSAARTSKTSLHRSIAHGGMTLSAKRVV